MLTGSPTKFAEWFNETYIGAYRRITARDVRVMTKCDLIGIYGFYLHTDLKTVQNILRYEHMRGLEPIHQDQENGLPSCKICGRSLPPNPEGKAGRRRKYCTDCETHRSRHRQAKFRHRKRLYAVNNQG